MLQSINQMQNTSYAIISIISTFALILSCIDFVWIIFTLVHHKYLWHSVNEQLFKFCTIEKVIVLRDIGATNFYLLSFLTSENFIVKQIFKLRQNCLSLTAFFTCRVADSKNVQLRVCIFPFCIVFVCELNMTSLQIRILFLTFLCLATCLS